MRGSSLLSNRGPDVGEKIIEGNKRVLVRSRDDAWLREEEEEEEEEVEKK